MALTSTVPGAVAVLETHFVNVQAQLAALDLSLHVGMPIAEVNNDYLMIGNWQSGELVADYRQDWAAFPALRKSETYGLLCSLRAWSGDSDPVGRITDAWSILDAAQTELASDVGGSGALSPSGSWQITEIETPYSGPDPANGGWGIYLTFTVAVANVRIQPA